MFSLVTALVSPHAIDVLRKKKDTIVSTLTENANVLCFQPNEDVCLLQGEWESIKKAYAILEEFYFRAQAEVMVREMLKVNGCAESELVGEANRVDFTKKLPSSLLPVLEPQFENSPSGNRVANNKNYNMIADTKTAEGGRKQHKDYGHTLSLAHEMDGDGKRNERIGGGENCNAGENFESTHVDTTTETVMPGENEDEDDDDDPPVLYRENTDVISVSSEISDQKELDFYEHFSKLPHSQTLLPGLEGTPRVRSENISDLEPVQQMHSLKNSDDDEDEDENRDEHLATSDLTSKRKMSDDVMSEQSKDKMNGQQSYGLTVTSPRFLLNQQVVNAATAFRSQQYFKETVSSRKLPEFASLFLGGTTLPQGMTSWQYADLYSMHLSALQTMHVKQEPSSTISSSNVASMRFDDDFKNINLGYRFDDDTQVQEMRCMRCDKTYRSEARMKEHVRTHDKDYVPVLHSCPKCGKSFTYRHNMVVHLRRFHYGWQPAKRHACRVCGIKFQKPYLLRLHEHKAHLLRLPNTSME